MLLRWSLFVVTVGLLAAAPPAAAVRVRARFPAVVTTGALVRVPGRVSGSSQVRIEQRVRGRRLLPAWPGCASWPFAEGEWRGPRGLGG